VTTVVHRGRTLATAEARLTAGDRLLAHGSAALLIRPPDARTA
jgi:acyl-coenzyme A thioesterase PaaI-like protein